MEALREFGSRYLFTSLAGITAGRWRRLLRANGWSVSARYWPRAAFLSAVGLINSALAAREARGLGARLDAVSVPDPLFILGHWRGGTTLLFNLLALDPQFAWPTMYQAIHPLTFLTTESRGARLLSPLLPRTRAVDGMAQSFRHPMEDEFALAALTGLSPYLGWSFPRRADHYDRYLTFHAASDAERQSWRAGLDLFVRKLTLRYDRPLILKSPPHTARIRMILELYPRARFVHIHRDPYAVYPSMLRLARDGVAGLRLQVPSMHDLEERTLARYEELYDAYFADRKLIPPGRQVEVAYADLVADAPGQLKRVYDTLGLGGFNRQERAIGATMEREAPRHPGRGPSQLTERERGEIARRWARCFAEWRYPT